MSQAADPSFTWPETDNPRIFGHTVWMKTIIKQWWTEQFNLQLEMTYCMEDPAIPSYTQWNLIEIRYKCHSP